MRIANLKKAVWGLMAFASTLVCVMDCYPLIPAVYGVYCLSSGHTIIFYIGLIIGMGYFISIPSICKYLFIIAVIFNIKFSIYNNHNFYSFLFINVYFSIFGKINT